MEPSLDKTRLVTALALCLAALGGCGGDRPYVPSHVSGAGADRKRPSGESAFTGPTLRPDGQSVQYAAPGAQRMQLAVTPAPSPFNTEQYHALEESDFRLASEQPLSTFSVDVDTASYSNVRRFLSMGQLPPADAVRVEELINYFSYEQPRPAEDGPVAVSAELARSPFATTRALVRIGVRASAPAEATVPQKRFVFLIDVSGSMRDANKLPLLQRSLALLVPQLGARDTVAIVTYAGSSGVALEPTAGDQHEDILQAVDALSAGGSTNGAAGIELAYQLARENCRRGDNCRVLLATDGDFNVGVTDEGSLLRLIRRERDAGVFLTVLGFGMGNVHDGTMELLADKGDGSYAYIDTLREAQKVLVEQASATLRTVAKDTKIQVEWNPERVSRYRLIGYENRQLNEQDFNDDQKDAGDMGDGHSVTALYEVELHGASGPQPSPRIDALKYQTGRAPTAAARGDELLTVKLRYKTPGEAESRLLTRVLRGQPAAFEQASRDLRFAAAVAGFGMLLRASPYLSGFHYADVDRIARAALGEDRDGYRHEFLSLVASAARLSDR